ncbi:MAG: STAS domain-containing protein [Pseudomonadota bacterium]
MNSGSILHANHEGVVVLRFVGDIRYMLAPALDRFLDGAFSEPGLAGFVIDLTGTDGIDSTCLGILARIAKRMEIHGRPRISIVSNRVEINEVLLSMGLDEVFEIVTSSVPETGNSQELAAGETDDATLARTLLKAHRTLMTLNEHNRELFREVVSTLERETAGQS